MNQEKTFSKNEVLLSTTDLKGRIKYSNDIFCNVAEYSLNELKNKPHNIVRHPDMPKTAFKDLWSTIKSGKSWMGPVKNLCKNGDYYWVNAFVTPIRNKNGEVFEYQSVRTYLNEKVKSRAEKLYSKLKNNKKVKQYKIDKTLWVQASLLLTTFISFLLWEKDDYSILNNILTFLLLVSSIIFYIWRKQYKAVLKSSNEIFENPLMSYIYSGTNDRLGDIILALKMRKAEMRAVVGRVNNDSESLTLTAKKSSDLGNDVYNILSSQKHETEQIANAILEMTSTVEDISNIVSKASDISKVGLKLTKEGQKTLTLTSSSIHESSEQLTKVDTAINRLIEGTQSIEKILTEISGIAEQTNLLALNAAIEAARAGDKGRGFAVVADEVRSLAMRSQQSTEVIVKLTNELREESDYVIDLLSKGRSISLKCIDSADSTNTALENVDKEITYLAELNTNIASAIEEQSVVAKQINKSIKTISEMSLKSETNGKDAALLGVELVNRLLDQQKLISQFNR